MYFQNYVIILNLTTIFFLQNPLTK